jgi:hypothetical protein
MKFLLLLCLLLPAANATTETRLALKRGGHLTVRGDDWRIIDGSKIGEGVEFLLIHKRFVDLTARIKAGQGQTGVPALKKNCQGTRDTFYPAHRPYCLRRTSTGTVLEFVHVTRTQQGYVYIPYTVHFDGTVLQLSTWQTTIESFALLLGSRP